MRTYHKDPDAKLDYSIDWTTWLNGDTLTTSTWTVEDGITKDSDSKTTVKTTIWLSGGTLNNVYSITNHIVTATGRENDKTFKVHIAQN